MIEKILNKKKLYALIVRKSYRKKKGVSFFTDEKATQQFGYMNHQKGHNILKASHPHGGGQIISIDHKTGKLTGASDPRKDGIAIGY